MNRIVAAACACFAICVALFTSASAQKPRSTWDGVYTDAQAERGRAVYEASCQYCHGADLYKGLDYTPPISGSMFLSNYEMLPVGTLYERIRVTMPEGEENSLGRQKYTDLLAYILFRNGFPSGAAELPADLNELNQITLLALKP